MKNGPLEGIRGSGNVFRDLGHVNADVEQFKALLAAEIIKALDRENLTYGGRTPAQESRRPTSPAFATPILHASLSIAWSASSTASAPGLRSSSKLNRRRARRTPLRLDE
jgi:hypothetical protein